tara:strand:+ start:1553 stop:1972 length:420 start_codon:yes stop_codon:yes gene_type:complete
VFNYYPYGYNENILAAVDFSDFTDAVIDAACEQASLSGVLIRVVHVAALDPAYVGFNTGPVYDFEYWKRTLDEEDNKLKSIVYKFNEHRVHAVPDLPEEPIVEILLKEVDYNDIDLIFVGPHGHGDVFNIIAGSAAQAL